MLEFSYLWLLALLPLPLLIRLLPGKYQEEAALRLPSAQQVASDEVQLSQASSKKPIRLALLSIVWLCIILAATDPKWVGDPIRLPASGRDLLLAVDTSGSMQAEDMQLNNQPVNRLSAVKHIVGGFMERRSTDRVGLVLFGENAYLQAPLTFDRDTVNTLLQESFLGIAGDRGTAIGDAIGLSIKRLSERPESSRVLILLTDGANNSGKVTPLKAAELAAQKNVKIYTIGIGADEMIVQGFFGNRRVNPSEDLDEKTLTEIADVTGGQYFRARNTEELENIYALLDELEPIEQEAETFRPTKALFYIPLTIALISSLLLSLLTLLRRG